jgi:hypothetical protein
VQVFGHDRLVARSLAAPRGPDALQSLVRVDAETFVIGSTYAGDGSFAAFEDEIYLAYTDGTGFVRLAHTRSEGAAMTAAGALLVAAARHGGSHRPPRRLHERPRLPETH